MDLSVMSYPIFSSFAFPSLSIYLLCLLVSLVVAIIVISNSFSFSWPLMNLLALGCALTFKAFELLLQLLLLPLLLECLSGISMRVLFSYSSL